MRYRPPEPKTPLSLPIPWRRLRYNIWCIGWSQNELARRMRLDDSSVRAMCRGKRRCPDEVAIHTEQLAAIHRAMWEPPMWEPAGKAAELFMEPSDYDDPDNPEVAEDIVIVPRHLLPENIMNAARAALEADG